MGSQYTYHYPSGAARSLAPTGISGLGIATPARRFPNARGILTTATIALALSVSGLALSMRAAKATDYNQTVQSDLQIGDTIHIITTSAWVNGLEATTGQHWTAYGDNTITIDGYGDTGAAAKYGGSLELRGTNIVIHGSDSTGVNAYSPGSQISLSDVHIYMDGDDANGIVYGGSYASYAGASVNIDHKTTISLTGKDSVGITTMGNISPVIFSSSDPQKSLPHVINLGAGGYALQVTGGPSAPGTQEFMEIRDFTLTTDSSDPDDQRTVKISYGTDGAVAHAADGGTIMFSGTSLLKGGHYMIDPASHMILKDNVEATSNTTFLNNGELTFDSDDNKAFEGTIIGSGTLLKNGNGLLALSGANAYSGGTTVSGGTLSVASDANLGDGAGSLTLDGGTLQVTGAQFTSTTRAVTLGDHGGGFDIADAGNTFTVAQQLSGQGAVWKRGDGTLILSVTNSYSGGTTVSGGTLSVASDDNLGNSAGGLTLDGGTLQVTGTQFTSTTRTITLGDHGGGFDIADAGNTFTVAQQLSGQGAVWKRGDGTLVLSGDNSFAGGLTVENGTARAGIADHAFGSGLLTVKDGATADFANFNMTTGGLAGAGHVAMGSGNLTLDQGVDTLFSGVIDGSGTLTKAGSGTLTLAGANTYTGRTTVSGGTLKQGAQGAFNAASSGYEVAADGTLDLGGFSASLVSLDNAGNINFGGSGGTVLNVAGNYVGNGGVVTINTVLGGDNSKTDMLKVGGDTSGATRLYVNNVGGTGALTVNGIKVVDVAGASAGTFSLANSYTTKDGQQAVVGGAYAYTLQQGGADTVTDGDWYLVSHLNGSDPDPRYSAGVPIYEGYVQNMLALNKLPTLQERVGSRYWTGENGNGSDNGATVNNAGVWARVEGAHNRLEPDTSTSRMKQDINTFIMQAGVDGQFYEGGNGRLIGGITGQYGHAKGDVSSFHGDGDISTDAWSLGATATWYGNNGFYIDGQGQVTWFDNDLDSWTANTGLANGRKATGYAMSIEAGQRFAVDQNWSLTPQAQLMYSSIDADAFRDTWGSRVSMHHGDSLLGRIGLAANYANNWKGNDEQMVNTSVYGIANLYQEFLGGSMVDVSGIDFDTDNDRTWAGIGAGGTYAWATNKYAVYGEGSVNTSLNHFADSYTLKAIVGFKMKW